MSMPDSKIEYDAKKKFLEDIKRLDKSDYQEIFRIIKLNNVEFTENSNGIFFDLMHVDSSIFSQLQECILRSNKQKILEKERNAIVESMLTV